jgi:hypothetical protein
MGRVTSGSRISPSHLRHSKFLALREDKKAKDVVRE